MLIDSTYFVDKLNIPNANTQHPVGNAIRIELDKFIRSFEPRFLEQLLGKSFYAEFLAGLKVQNNQEQRWVDLRNKLIDTNLNESPIANYVYFFYASVKKELVFGLKDDKGENSLNGAYTVVDIWNDMVDKSYAVYEFLTENSETYPTFDNPFYFSKNNKFGI